MIRLLTSLRSGWGLFLLALLLVVPSLSIGAAGIPRGQESQAPAAKKEPPQSSSQQSRPPPRRRRPTRRPTPPVKTYSTRQLKALADDITSLSDQITALNQRTAQRLSIMVPADSIPIRRYRLAGDARRWQQLIRQHEDHPDDLATIVALADLEGRNFKLPAAEQYLMKALTLEPLNQDFLFDLGDLYLAKGEYSRAWTTFQEVVYLNPESVEARLAQGRVRELEGNVNGAMVIYNRVEEQSGPAAGLYVHRALNLVQRGDYGAAIALAREGLAMYLDHARLYYARGRAHAGLGLLDRAKTDFYDALSLDADLLEAYAALGEVSLQEGNATTAVRVYLRLLNDRPGDAAASLQLGRAYLMALRLEEAVREWELLAYLHPGYREVDRWLPQAYYLYSLELKDQGRFREAVEMQRKALAYSHWQSSDWVVTALLQAGESARAQDDYRRSIGYYQWAIENDPLRADGYVGLSRTYQAMQDSSGALSALRQALAIDPRHLSARMELDRILQP